VKILIVDTYYEDFLKDFYQQNTISKDNSYEIQKKYLINSCFGTSDFYSHNLNKIGVEAEELIVNCSASQKRWAKENGFNFIDITSKIPYKFFKLPLIRNKVNQLRVDLSIARKQIKKFCPDVLYCQDLSFFPGNVLDEIKKESQIKLVVGQIACPLPHESFLKPYDLIITSLPHFVEKLNAMGKKSEYLKIGFDSRILNILDKQERDIDFSFVGGISKHHNAALNNIEFLISNANMRIYGYGVKNVPFNSCIKKNHGGLKWGLEMYKILARTKISFNRHINISENNANNMRLFEATGMGSLLLTDMKDNLKTMYKIDEEVVCYRSKEEALEKVNFLINNEDKLLEIAKAGQARTLKEHTYEIRMKELIEIINNYI